MRDCDVLIGKERLSVVIVSPSSYFLTWSFWPRLVGAKKSDGIFREGDFTKKGNVVFTPQDMTQDKTHRVKIN